MGSNFWGNSIFICAGYPIEKNILNLAIRYEEKWPRKFRQNLKWKHLLKSSTEVAPNNPGCFFSISDILKLFPSPLLFVNIYQKMKLQLKNKLNLFKPNYSKNIEHHA
jgi:hypothetical protein